MATSRNVDIWVQDQLHDILGISDKYIAEYFISLAGKSSSGSDLVQKIEKTGTVDINNAIVRFADELMSKVFVYSKG